VRKQPTSFIFHSYPPMKMEQMQCSETSAYNIQTPGNYPEDNIVHPQHGGSLKTTTWYFFASTFRTSVTLYFLKPTRNACLCVRNISALIALPLYPRKKSKYFDYYKNCLSCSMSCASHPKIHNFFLMPEFMGNRYSS
jgi:hypothetical protein